MHRFGPATLAAFAPSWHAGVSTLRQFAAVALLSLAAAAPAAELRVLSAGAVKGLVVELAPAIADEVGRPFVVVTDTAGGLVRRVLAGEPVDLVIATRAGIDELERAGKVVPGSARPLVRVGIGAAVRQGDAAPAIDTPERFRAALLAARAVAYIDPAAGGSSGIYLAKLFDRMGIAPEMARKSVLVAGGLVADRLQDGRADLALQQSSELADLPGIQVIGPIPAALQNFTVYVGAVSATAVDPASARAALEALSRSPAADAAMRRRGMAAP